MTVMFVKPEVLSCLQSVQPHLPSTRIIAQPQVASDDVLQQSHAWLLREEAHHVALCEEQFAE